MIWAAVFVICTAGDCMAVGSPIFKDKDACEFSTISYGIGYIIARFPTYNVVSWQCVELGKAET